MPVESSLQGLAITRPEIYFGELTDTDVYVKTRQREFNYPQGEQNNLASYQGSGGIRLGGMLRRTIIAYDRGDIAKIPFSDDVTDDSRLLMRRNILGAGANARAVLHVRSRSLHRRGERRQALLDHRRVYDLGYISLFESLSARR